MLLIEIFFSLEGRAMVEKSVGLIIFTEIPGMGLVAVLRERGYFNFEKMERESWYGGCQVTVHGKLEERERGNFLLALRRELDEELGEGFSYNLWVQYSEKIVEVSRLQKQDKEVVTFAIKIDLSLLLKIRLSPDSGSLRFLPHYELDYVADLTLFSKETGIINRLVIAMFPDEKKAVADAFTRFS